jgi:integral membrane protein
MLGTPIGRLRFIGFVEGMSYLILLLVAMPLKYLAGMPLAVRIVGTAHGALFVLFFLSVAEVSKARGWWTGSFWGKAFIASIVPAGTFVFDRWLKRHEAADEPATTEAV